MKPTVSIHTTNKPWIWQNRFWVTASITAASFLLYLSAYGLGLIPNALVYQQHNSPTAAVATSTNREVSINELASASSVPQDELPKQIRIPAINIQTTVQNPASTRIAVLNRYLAESAVRYPESGKPGNGNMFIFGHSSGRDSVINQTYKTFNRLEDLSSGDKIFAETDSGTFTYAVTDVQFKKDSAAYVPFDTEKDMLTIATCDNFGAKEDRVVVRAEFTGYTAR